MENDKDILVIVAPKQKIVKIVIDRKIVKVYNFNMDVRKKVIEKEVTGYDYSEWSVLDRDYTYTKKVTVYDEGVIEEIRNKALEYYNNNK